MHSVRFYIPKNARWASPAIAGSYKGWPAETFRRLLTAKAGGFTKWDAQGVWKNEHGRVYDEPVTVFEVFTDNVHGLRNLARWFRANTAEESVLFVCDNQPEFI